MTIKPHRGDPFQVKMGKTIRYPALLCPPCPKLLKCWLGALQGFRTCTVDLFTQALCVLPLSKGTLVWAGNGGNKVKGLLF